MIKQNITLDETIKFLNELLETDEEAISMLVNNRVLCDKKLADHRTVQVEYDKLHGFYKVGFLGILNGLFGVDSCGYGAICAEIKNGVIIGFKKLNI